MEEVNPLVGTLTRRIGLGFTIGCDPAGGTAYAVLGAVVEGIKGPSAKAETVDTSILGDHYKQFLMGQVDPGEATFTIAYDPADTTTTTVLNNLFNTGNVAAFQITGTGTGFTETFKGVVVGLDRTIDRGKLVTSDVTIKVSGDPGYTHT